MKYQVKNIDIKNDRKKVIKVSAVEMEVITKFGDSTLKEIDAPLSKQQKLIIDQLVVKLSLI